MQKGQIVFNFLDRKTKTEILVFWNYPSKKEKKSEEDGDFHGAKIPAYFPLKIGKIRKSTLNHEKMIEKLRLRMNATELVKSQKQDDNKEQKNPEKIRCKACLDIYDEALGKCPRCGSGIY